MCYDVLEKLVKAVVSLDENYAQYGNNHKFCSLFKKCILLHILLK